MGAQAALAVLEAKPETAPCVICLDGNKISKRPLMLCVEKVCMCMFVFIITNSVGTSCPPITIGLHLYGLVVMHMQFSTGTAF